MSTATQSTAYQNRRNQKNRSQATLIEAKSEVGQLPPVVNPARRERGRLDLFYYLQTYYPESTGLTPFSEDHRNSIQNIENLLLRGGRYAQAVYRGFSKTTIGENSCIWATTYGHRKFMGLFGAEGGLAAESIDSIRKELEGNPLLEEDFPEICIPVQKLEGKFQRCAGQTWNGNRTYMKWTGNWIALPTMEGYESSGGIILARGILSAGRGIKVKHPDGRNIRPDGLIIDDFQTDDPLAVNTPVLTPDGFKQIGEIQVGDIVFSENGEQIDVVATSPVFENRDCYKITFDDGNETISDGRHKWVVQNQLQRTNQRRRSVHKHDKKGTQYETKPLYSVRTTEEMASSTRNRCEKDGKTWSEYSIDFNPVMQVDYKELPIDPYTLGAWLGDGSRSSARVTSMDSEVPNEIQAAGYEVTNEKSSGQGLATSYYIKGIRGKLRSLRVWCNKHIPQEYLMSSECQRLSLLQGLMDTDGSVTLGSKGIKGTRFTFTNTNRNLIDGVYFLCRSLGIKATIKDKGIPKPKKILGVLRSNLKKTFTVCFVTNKPVFRIKRKLEKIPSSVKKTVRRVYIRKIEKIESQPVRCISVDSETNLFLHGNGLIPTHNSARHPGQVTQRLKVIKKGLLKTAGHRKKLGCIVNGTVIEENDGMEQLLDDPGWQSNRVPLVKQWADRHEDMWLGTYKSMRLDFDKEVAGSQEKAHGRANEFYRKNQDEMDAGCLVSWQTCFDEECEDSAIQHAYNLFIDDGEEVFSAECQQRPLSVTKTDDDFLTQDKIQEKQHPYKRNVVPQEVDKVTGFIDIQKEVLIHETWGFSTKFDGYKIDDGTFPDQRLPYWEKSSLKYKMSEYVDEEVDYKKMSHEARLYQSLTILIDKMFSKTWTRDMDGVEMQISKLGIDARYMNKTIRKVYRDSKHKSKIQLCMGYGIGAKKTPMSKKKTNEDNGEKKGFGWFLGKANAGIQTLETDVNVLKTFVHRRFATPLGQSGSFSMFKESFEHENRLSAMHYSSEFRTTLKGPHGEVDEWDNKPGNPDNDKFDCLVGCTAIASFTGTEMVGAENEKEKKKPRQEFNWDSLS